MMKRRNRLATLAILMVTCMPLIADDKPTEPTGASLAWTSDDPAVAAARNLMTDGKFADAEAAVRAEGGDAAARAEMLEIIRRTRRDYALSAAGLVAKLQPSLPGVTAAEVERWRAAGEVQSRTIDGQVAYFGREPSNIFRFCGEAKSRRPSQAAATSGWTLAAHLRAVIAEAERTGATEVLPVKHTVTYRVTVPTGAQSAVKPGSVVRVWLPFPQEYRRQQTDVRLISATGGDGAPTVAPAARGEHHVTEGAPQRTLYLERKLPADAALPKELVFETRFQFTSSAYYPKLDEKLAQPLPADWSGGHLTERLPHIAFTPELRAAVAHAVGDETNPLARARRIFRWVSTNIAYHAEEEYCNIPSFSAKAMRCRRGDCGVQAMLFITMCRAAGIPARWQSGWESKPVNWNMHDWAEFYCAPWGWLPCDPSYGIQADAGNDPRVVDFYCGHQDSYRMIVNRDYGYPLVPPKPTLRSEPADFQRGEIEVDGRNIYYDQWDYDMTFEWDAKP